MTTLDNYRDEFAERGLCLVRESINCDVALEWAERACALAEKRVDREPREVKCLDEGGARNHAISDAVATAQSHPELFGFYEVSRLWLSHITQRDVVCSPYQRSAITLKVYDRPGDGQGWHKDTNALTCLLILTETDGNYGTEIEERDGTHLNLRNLPGDCLVMAGRELRHMVPPLPKGKFRVTVPMNYYFTDDLWRPDWADDMVYE